MTFTWYEETSPWDPYSLEGLSLRSLREAAKEARSRLGTLVGLQLDLFKAKQELAEAGRDAPHTLRTELESNVTKVEKEYEDTCRNLVQAGHELYKRLFLPQAGSQRDQARRVYRWLEGLPSDNPIEVLEIVILNEAPWSIPWNLVYERSDTAPLRPANESFWDPFWGYRYNLGSGRRVDALRRQPLRTPPAVLLVNDLSVVTPEEQEQLKEIGKFCQSTLVHTRTDLERMIRSGAYDLIYWLGHATPGALELGEDSVTPEQLYTLLTLDYLDRPEQPGGLAFLNGCRTGEPYELGSFLDALAQAGLTGMVGTEQVVIDVFAKQFGLSFLRDFLGQGEMVGTLLRRLRREKLPVPLGLVYGVYCPPSLRVRQPAAQPADTGMVVPPADASATPDPAASVAQVADGTPDPLTGEGNFAGPPTRLPAPPPVRVAGVL
jgi:hypothetical protein